MDKRDCLNLIGQFFELKSCIVTLKNPDFELKSHIFFFKDVFKEVDEIKILSANSKNLNDNILFDIYYVSEEFDGLFHGYFRIKPESDNAIKLFENVSKYCTDLGEYIYYVYQNSELLKIYLISGNIQSALEHIRTKSLSAEFGQFKKKVYEELAGFSSEQFPDFVLDRRFNSKYIYNFMLFNSKCSEEVKMFLLNILTSRYSNSICLLTSGSSVENYIQLDSDTVYYHGNSRLPIYGILDFVVDEQFVVFIKFDFDFEGGVNFGKTTGKR